MKVFESSDIRNVAVLGHGHSGKTSLCSALLFTAGVTDRQLSVNDGNTVMDFDEEEIARKLTISSKVAAFPWGKIKINLIDTPGYNLLLHDTRTALTAADSAVLVVDGVAGVEVCTRKVWDFAKALGLPAAIVINKLDRERSSFERTLQSVQSSFGRGAVPVQLPIGSEKGFTGIIDVIRMRALQYSDSRGKATECDIPASQVDAATKAHEALVEMVAEGNDELMEEFFATSTLPIEHIIAGLKEAVRERRITPVLCAAACRNLGSDQLLNFCLDVFPSPIDVPGRPVTKDGVASSSKVQAGGPAAVLVFKTACDPFAGRISYFKVVTGSVKEEAHLCNMRTIAGERLAHIAVPFGKALQPVPELRAGDIGAVPKLKDTITGDTLAEQGSRTLFQFPENPDPAIAYAISAKTRSDEDRLSAALTKMLEEDRALRFYRDTQTREFLLAGNGQQHLEIVVSRLKRRFGVEVELKAPKIPYRETIRGSASVQGRHKKQTGGHGQFGDCWIRIEPLPRGEKFQFANEIYGGAIPKQYIPAVEKGIAEAAAQGFLAGYPVTDFKVTLFDGSFHDVDSSEMAFKIAGRKAFRAAMQMAKPALLEPVMKVEVEAPPEFAGDLMSDFSGRRGRVTGMDSRDGQQVIRAQVPMAEMLSYQDDLTSKTQGRASFHMEFDHYDLVPGAQADKLIAAGKAHLQSDDDE